jgi:hypothetical protein
VTEGFIPSVCPQTLPHHWRGFYIPFGIKNAVMNKYLLTNRNPNKHTLPDAYYKMKSGVKVITNQTDETTACAGIFIFFSHMLRQHCLFSTASLCIKAKPPLC